MRFTDRHAARTWITAALLTLFSLLVSASAVLADGGGNIYPK